MIDARIVLGDPTMVPDRGGHPRRVAAGPGRPRPARRAARRARRPPAGDAHAGTPPTRTCSSCTRARSRSRSGTSSCSTRSSASAQRLVELDAAKDEFLRGISHNLQTPLTSIRAYAEQIGSERAGPAARRSSSSSPNGCTGSSASSWRRRASSRARSARPRRCSRSRRASAARGTRSAPPDVPFELAGRGRGLAGDRRPGPARPGPLGAARQLGAVRRGSGDSRPRGAPARRRASSAVTIADGGPGVRAGGSRPDLRALRARRGGRGRRGHGARAVRLALAVPGDGRRSRARTGRLRAPAPRSPSCSRGAAGDRVLTRRGTPIARSDRGSTKGCCASEPMAR